MLQANEGSFRGKCGASLQPWVHVARYQRHQVGSRAPTGSGERCGTLSPWETPVLGPTGPSPRDKL